MQTLIFDCCHSAGGSRDTPENARYIDKANLPELPASPDKNIINNALSGSRDIVDPKAEAGVLARLGGTAAAIAAAEVCPGARRQVASGGHVVTGAASGRAGRDAALATQAEEARHTATGRGVEAGHGVQPGLVSRCWDVGHGLVWDFLVYYPVCAFYVLLSTCCKV